MGLLGFAGFFLYTKIEKNREVTDELDRMTQELVRLVGRDPHPGSEQVDNISEAKKEGEKLQEFLGEVKQFFPPMLSTNQFSDRDFRRLLDRTVDELQREAETAGVELPAKEYDFTFAPQKASVTYASDVTQPLTGQLLEIKALCDILYNAKVVAIQNLKRTTVATNDTGYTDYMTNKPVTNEYAIATPYEVTFTGHSSQLAMVMEGVAQSPVCFVIKNLAVDQAGSAPPLDETTMQEYSNPYPASRYGMPSRYGPPGPFRGGGMSPDLMRRYGITPSEGFAPQPVAPRSRSGISTFLEEQLLRITLSVDAVKLKPTQ